jgi:single-stranded-DNA-specific exonuclease
VLPTCTFDDIRLISIDDDILKIAGKMNCSDVVAAVLSSRGEDGPINIEDFRIGGIDESLSSLDLGPGVSEAADTWKRAVSSRSVLVYGDYDVDGIASTALAVELTGVSGASSVHYYLPHRQKEGYGVHLPLIRRALAQGVQTLIVTDCGSKDVEPLREAVDGGMAVIVFDHHSVDGDTIDLPAFVNPQRGGSGVGPLSRPSFPEDGWRRDWTLWPWLPWPTACLWASSTESWSTRGLRCSETRDDRELRSFMLV